MQHTETTEWEDIQVKMGNMPQRQIIRAPTAEEYDEDAANDRDLLESAADAVLDKASLEQLHELEDDFEDDKVLEEYRKKRIAEMQNQALKDRFGTLTTITEQDYKREVTEAGDVWVVVFLYKFGLPHCQLLEQHLNVLARKFKSTKFVQIKAEHAIKNYPDKNLPTLLIYYQSDVKQQFLGLKPFGGEGMTTDELEWQLAQVGAIASEMEGRPRKQKSAAFGSSIIGRSRPADDDDDDD